jgi:hypothetical protein
MYPTIITAESRNNGNAATARRNAQSPAATSFDPLTHMDNPIEKIVSIIPAITTTAATTNSIPPRVFADVQTV